MSARRVPQVRHGAFPAAGNGTAAGSSVVRVRQVPAAHAYVENLLPVPRSGDGTADPRAGATGLAEGAWTPTVQHLADPPVPGAAPGQWWPHPALDAAWVRTHARDQDVIHVHFGTEDRTLGQLAEWVGTLREAGLPLVHTVHDIDHPHLVDQARHREHLGLLVAEADGLLTLTEGAARIIGRDFGRRPLVVPHPHMAPLARIGADRVGEAGRERSGALRIGMHLKSLRTNLAPMRVLPALVEAVGALRSGGIDAQLEVRAHLDVLDPGGARHDARLASWWQELAGFPPPGVSLVLGHRLGDEELWDYLAGLDVSVLPYAWGTHSGWVEACRDLGTWVLAPDVGHLAEQGQGSVLAWGDPREVPSGAALTGLLLRAADAAPPAVSRADREAQREQAAALHRRLYAAVVAGQRVDGAVGQGYAAADQPGRVRTGG